MANRPTVFHHTQDIGLLAPADWCVLEYAAEDKTRAYAGVFKLAGPDRPCDYVLRPKGLDFSRDYEVTLDNSSQTFKMSGRELANTGLNIRLDNALTSELVLMSAV
jgi:alpha-galactosidase